MAMLFPGTPVQLVCVSSGVPQPTITWIRDGAILMNGTGGVSITYTWNTSELTVWDVNGEQGGDYNCTSSNVAGSASVMFEIECE